MLTKVFAYLSSAEQEHADQTVSANSLRKSYPPAFLYNLGITALIKQNTPTMPKNIKAIWGKKYSVFNVNIFRLFDQQLTLTDYSKFLPLILKKKPFSDSRQLHDFLDLKSLTDQQRKEVWDELSNDQLERLTSSLWSFVYLITSLGLSYEKYSTELLPGFKEKIEKHLKDGTIAKIIPDLETFHLVFSAQTSFPPRSKAQLSILRRDLKIFKEPILRQLMYSSASFQTISREIPYAAPEVQDVITDKAKSKIENVAHFLALYSHNSSKNQAEIYTAMQAKWQNIIHNVTDLIRILELFISSDRATKRKPILTAMNLDELIKNGQDFCDLWQYSLSDTTIIGKNIQTKLNKILKIRVDSLIRNGNDLYAILLLPGISIDWEKTTLNPTSLIQYGSQLCKLLALPLDKLPHLQRKTILDHFSTSLIQDGNQLYKLLKLPLGNIPAPHRESSLYPLLVTLIQSGNQLYDLLTLSLEQLPTEQRTAIWQAYKNKFNQLIMSNPACDSTMDLLVKFLSLPAALLLEHNFIWQFVLENIHKLVENGTSLNKLLKFLNEQNGNVSIVADIKAKIATLDFRQVITKTHEVYALLTAPYMAEIHQPIVETLGDRLESLIKNDRDLYNMIQLALNEKLGNVTCDDIWNKTIKEFPNRIHSFEDLNNLLNTNISLNLKSNILKTIIENLSSIITHSYQDSVAIIFDWLSLAPEPLQKNLLFKAIKDHLHKIIHNRFALDKLITLLENIVLQDDVINIFFDHLDSIITSTAIIERLLSNANQLEAKHKRKVFTYIVNNFSNLILFNDDMRETKLITIILSFYRENKTTLYGQDLLNTLGQHLATIINYNHSAIPVLNEMFKTTEELKPLYPTLWQAIEACTEKANFYSKFIQDAKSFSDDEQAKLAAFAPSSAISLAILKKIIKYCNRDNITRSIESLDPKKIEESLQNDEDWVLRDIFKLPLNIFPMYLREAFIKKIPKDQLSFDRFARLCEQIPESHLTLEMLLALWESNQDRITKEVISDTENIATFMSLTRIPRTIRDDFYITALKINSLLELHSFFELPLEQLSFEKRKAIWGKLTIQDLPIYFESLHMLAELPNKKFPQEWFNALIEKRDASYFATVIETPEPDSDPDPIDNFLAYWKEPRLPKNHRTALYEALKMYLNKHQHSALEYRCTVNIDLASLFKAPYFCEEQRQEIWDIVLSSQPYIDFDYYDLFALPISRFSQQMREAAFTLQPNLIPTDEHYNELPTFFELSLVQFTQDQRNTQWQRIQPSLSAMIKSSTCLFRLLSLPLEKLSCAQRQNIWQALKNQLFSLLFKNPDYKLLALLLNSKPEIIMGKSDESAIKQHAEIKEKILKELPSLLKRPSAFCKIYTASTNDMQAKLLQRLTHEKTLHHVPMSESDILLLLELYQQISQNEKESFKEMLTLKFSDFLDKDLSNDYPYNFFEKFSAICRDNAEIYEPFLAAIEEKLPGLHTKQNAFFNLFSLPLNQERFNKFWAKFSQEIQSLDYSTIELKQLVALLGYDSLNKVHKKFVMQAIVNQYQYFILHARDVTLLLQLYEIVSPTTPSTLSNKFFRVFLRHVTKTFSCLRFCKSPINFYFLFINSYVPCFSL